MSSPDPYGDPPARRRYLDAASTTPLLPAARAALLAALDDGWADPRRLYHEARAARLLLDGARESIAGAIGSRADEVTFTPSGTLACQLAVLGVAAGRRRTGTHVVAGAVEHSAVLHVAEHADAGYTVVGVDRAGRVDAEEFAAALTPATAAACLQSANHEVGTLQPVGAVAERCAAAGVPLVVDAAGSVGQVPVSFAETGAAALIASAHKWGGPAGVGVLAVRKGTRFRSPLPGGSGSERLDGFTAIPAVVAAAVALDSRVATMHADNAAAARLTARLSARVAAIDDVELLGPADPAHRLPHLIAFSCLYVDGEALLGELDAAGYGVSSGSSCTSDTLVPSHVLAAMGVLTHGNVRVSIPPPAACGTPVTEADVDGFAAALADAVRRVRDRAGAAGL